MAVYLDQIEAFPVLKQPKASELQRFADLLDVTVVNLKDSGRAYELQESTLYCKLQTKLSASMLTNYNRWCHVNSRPAHVESLLEWVNLEAEFTMNAVETIEGISGGTTKSAESNKQPHRDFTARTYFSSDQAVPASGRVAKSLSCQCCHGNHNIWKCPQFKESSVQERWQVAKTAGLCFRCLGSGHRSNACTWSRVCGLNDCKEHHHRLLHSGESTDTAAKKQMTEETSSAETSTEGVMNDSDVSFSTSHVECSSPLSGSVSTRTIPVILRNGKQELRVNGLLDDGSTRSYLNADIAAQLGLSGTPQQVTVGVLNGQKETFVTTPVTMKLMSLDRREVVDLKVYTVDQVTGSMKATDWSKESCKWPHLKDIDFPSLGKRRQVDLLIGLDQPGLHFALRDVRGGPGEPVARLTPLGWTCVGPVQCETEIPSSTGERDDVGDITLHSTSIHVKPDFLLHSSHRNNWIKFTRAWVIWFICLFMCLSTPLTPENHLFGQASAVTAQSSADSSWFTLKYWWRRVQELVEYVWKSCIREWLTQLSFRKKWKWFLTRN